MQFPTGLGPGTTGREVYTVDELGGVGICWLELLVLPCELGVDCCGAGVMDAAGADW